MFCGARVLNEGENVVLTLVVSDILYGHSVMVLICGENFGNFHCQIQGGSRAFTSIA